MRPLENVITLTASVRVSKTRSVCSRPNMISCPASQPTTSIAGTVRPMVESTPPRKIFTERCRRLSRAARTAPIAYVVTFLVLATFWLGRAHTKEEPERASGAYAWSVLFHLFFVTLLPFSMVVVGRYDLAPAICVYGANMVLLALTAIGITLVIERDIQRRLVPSGRLEYGVLIASAILSVVIGFYSPDSAMYAYFLNLASPLFRRLTERV